MFVVHKWNLWKGDPDCLCISCWWSGISTRFRYQKVKLNRPCPKTLYLNNGTYHHPASSKWPLWSPTSWRLLHPWKGHEQNPPSLGHSEDPGLFSTTRGSSTLPSWDSAVFFPMVHHHTTTSWWFTPLWGKYSVKMHPGLREMIGSSFARGGLRSGPLKILIFIWLPGSFSSQLPRVGDVFTHPTFNLYNRESLWIMGPYMNPLWK